MEEKKLDKDINVRSKDDTEIDVGMSDVKKAVMYMSSMGEKFPYIDNGHTKVMSFSNILDLIHRLHSENERLAEEKKTLAKVGKRVTEINESLIKTNEMLVDKGNALQKQVDERENEIDRLEKVVHEQAEQYYDCKERTAKNILQELWDETEPTENDEWVRVKIQEIAKRKGVEVE